MQLEEKGEHQRQGDLTAAGLSVHTFFKRLGLLPPFFGLACGVSHSRPDVGLREVGVEIQNLSDGDFGGHQAHQGANRDPGAFDSALFAHHEGIDRQPFPLREAQGVKTVRFRFRCRPPQPLECWRWIAQRD